MRIKETIFLLFLLAGFLFHGAAQNVTLVVTTTNGEEQTYQLTEASLLHFNNGESLVIDDGTDTPTTIPLSQIRKIVCSEMTDTEENSATNPLILPNPSRNGFLIKNLKSSCLAHIYALDGRLIKSFMATEGMLVDISGMVPGMYLLHIDGQILKLMKL